ncbi:MAG: M1 family metallopeptidase [Firmicutes bacterium]|nr:M1 family metallopeptidase [Bacillota bacterium]
MHNAQRTILLSILMLSLIMAAALFSGCSPNGDSQKLSSYTIDVTYNDNQKALAGKMTLDYRNNYDVELGELAFHLYPAAYREGARFKPVDTQDIAQAYPNGENFGGITVPSVLLGGKEAEHRLGGQDDDILYVTLKNALMPGASVKIEMTFNVSIPNMRHRFGWFDKTVNLGNFYPIACVYENGAFVTDPYYAWGDPFYSECANYTVSITAPAKFTAATSGRVETEYAGTEHVKSTSVIEKARDFAVVLGEFSQKEAVTSDGVKVLYYYHDDPTPELSLAAALDSVKTFSNLFGGYPYKTFSTVQTAFLNGGMEYPGLTYISDRLSGELYREVIIHEAAHQWWYGGVGNNQVKHAWVDEALAEYSTTLFYEKNPSYNVTYNKRIADALSNYTIYCDLYKNRPDFSTSMNRRLPDFRGALEYTCMTYIKGQIMMDSLRANIGDEAFFAGLKNYFSDNLYGVGSPELLCAAFETASKKQLAPFFTAWADGKIQVFAN